MDYVLFDIDGTLADSSHRNAKLPAIAGKQIICAKSRSDIIAGMKGQVLGRYEHPGLEQTVVHVRWEHPTSGAAIDKNYLWDDYMTVSGESFIPWHQNMEYDKPIEAVCDILRCLRPMLLSRNQAVIFLTSRWESSRADTLAWLTGQGLTCPGFNDKLLMRPDADARKDVIYKGAVLDAQESQGNRILMAFEDRRAMANYLRERGIPTMHVADYE